MRKKLPRWRLWAAQLWKKEHEVFTAFLEFSRKNKLYLITWVHLAPLTLLVELLQKNEPEKSFLNNISPQFSFSDADLISWTATTPQRKCKTEAPEEQKKNSKRVTTQNHSHFFYPQTKLVEGESISFQKYNISSFPFLINPHMKLV